MNIRYSLPLLLAVSTVWAASANTALGQLTLTVDRVTGATAIVGGEAALNLDGYAIRSANGLVDPNGWSSLADQAETGWEEVDNLSANEIGELNAAGSKTLAIDSTTAIGAALTTDSSVYDAIFTNVGFGVGVEDLVFEYNILDSPALSTGQVIYSGRQRFNNLVLDVNTSTGNVTLTNESSVAVAIDHIAITSAEGQLSTSWNGLRDTETGWVGGAGGSDSANGLAEFVPASDSYSVNGGASFDLGSAFNVAFDPVANPTVDLEDLDLSFEFGIVGEDDPFGGAVRYELAASENADFNSDSQVDGTDFLAWQRGFGVGSTLAEGDANGDGSVNGADLAIWENQYGGSGTLAASVAAVPEPSTACLALFSMVSCMAVQRRRL